MGLSVDLDDWVRRIRSLDPVTFEDAYFGERPEGGNVVARLISELRASADAYTRGKFCELLGEMGDASAEAVLTEELTHPDERVREWATVALKELKSVEARVEKAAHLARFRVRED